MRKNQTIYVIIYLFIYSFIREEKFPVGKMLQDVVSGRLATLAPPHIVPVNQNLFLFVVDGVS